MGIDAPKAAKRVEDLDHSEGARSTDLSRQVQNLQRDHHHGGRESRLASGNDSAKKHLPEAEVGGGAAPRFGGVVDNHSHHRAKLLLDPSATPEQRLGAVRELVKAGKENMTVHGNDGESYKLRLERERHGGRELLHVYVSGKDGKEQIALRGAVNKNGEFERQKDSSGKEVGWYGGGAAMLQKALPTDSPDAQKGTVRGQRIEELQRRNPETAPLDFRVQPQAGTGEGLGKQKVEVPDSVFKIPKLDFSSMFKQRDFIPNTEGNDRNPYMDQRTLDAQGAQVGRQVLDRAAEEARQNSHRLIGTSNGIYMRSGFDVDADGSPRARQIDPHGQEHTSMRYANNRSLNAEEVPYMVLPKGAYQQHGVKLGDMVLVRNTNNGKMSIAVFGDVGPAHKTGEGSMALAQELGLNHSPTRGGTKKPHIEYLVLPNTHGDKPQNQAELLMRIAEQRKKYGLA